MSAAGGSGAASAVAEWRIFLGPRYRRFQGIGGSGAVVAALAGDGLTIPLLLALGASPALATVIGVLPYMNAFADKRELASVVRSVVKTHVDSAVKRLKKARKKKKRR